MVKSECTGLVSDDFLQAPLDHAKGTVYGVASGAEGQNGYADDELATDDRGAEEYVAVAVNGVHELFVASVGVGVEWVTEITDGQVGFGANFETEGCKALPEKCC